MVNSLFSFSENVFLLPSFLKEISTGYGIQVDRVLFFFSFLFFQHIKDVSSGVFWTPYWGLEASGNPNNHSPVYNLVFFSGFSQEFHFIFSF